VEAPFIRTIDAQGKRVARGTTAWSGTDGIAQWKMNAR
jgi:hypothetical protein